MRRVGLSAKSLNRLQCRIAHVAAGVRIGEVFERRDNLRIADLGQPGGGGLSHFFVTVCKRCY